VVCDVGADVLCLGCFVLVSSRGLRTGVDVRALRNSYALSRLFLLGRSVVDSCGACPQGRCVALCFTIFTSFPYKLLPLSSKQFTFSYLGESNFDQVFVKIIKYKNISHTN
jgi:hypothetical protein